MDTDFLQVMTQQNEQIIDILMLILKNNNPKDAALVEYAHNTKEVFLSQLSQKEFNELYQEAVTVGIL